MSKILKKGFTLVIILSVIFTQNSFFIYAQSNNSIDKVPEVEEDHTFDDIITAPKLRIEEREVNGFGTEAQAFNLKLHNAEWFDDIVNELKKFNGTMDFHRITDEIIDVKIHDPKENRTEKLVYDIPLLADVMGAGDVEVEIIPEESTVVDAVYRVTPGVYKFAFGMEDDDKDDLITFLDDNLKQALMDAGVDTNSDGHISISEAQKPTYIWLRHKNIENINGLEYFKNLTTLYLGHNKISDINSLRGLTNLKRVHLDGNKISDISSLRDLVKLEYLDLSSNNISDISSLRGLTNLTRLPLGNNKISDISSLRDLVKLEYLYLHNNNIRDISSLKRLTNLTYLSIGYNKISDISSLRDLVKLKSLYLYNNNIRDIGSLSGLTNLIDLSISHNNISDISGLSGLTNLEKLGLVTNNISDISSLKRLTNLAFLNIKDNKISDISSLSKLTNLTYLNISNNNINNNNTPGAIHKKELDFTVDGKIYEVWVAIEDSQNNHLSDLFIDVGKLDPIFHRTELNYKVSVGNAIKSIKIIPTVESALSIVKINDMDVSSSTEYLTIDLNVGENIVEVEVIAENGDKKIYTIRVKRNSVKDNVITFVDTNLQKALIDESVDTDGDGDISINEAQKQTYLSLNDGNIENINGLEYFSNLMKLDLSNNKIRDISSLRGLTNLRYLGLGSNKISDISSLSGLTNLKILDLSNNNINNKNTPSAIHKTNLDFTVYGRLYEVWVVSSSSSGRGSKKSNSSKNVDGDAEINKGRGTSTPTINLNDDQDGKTSISLKTLKEIKKAHKTMVVENKGIKIGFKPDSIEGKEESVGVTLGAKEVTKSEKEKIIEKAKIGESTGLFEVGGKVFDLTANIIKEKKGTKTEEKIKEFGEPVEVTLDLSELKLSKEDIKKLTAIRYEKDEKGNVKPVKLGGKYDSETKSFTFYTDKFSLYSVVKAEKLLEIDLIIGKEKVLVNKETKKNDVVPQIINNRTMVPVRFIAENMGALVGWNEEIREVTIELDGQKTSMIIDEDIEGLNIAPTIVEGRTLVPLRYVSEKLGVNVMWFPEDKKVHIVK